MTCGVASLLILRLWKQQKVPQGNTRMVEDEQACLDVYKIRDVSEKMDFNSQVCIKMHSGVCKTRSSLLKSFRSN